MSSKSVNIQVKEGAATADGEKSSVSASSSMAPATGVGIVRAGK